MELIDSCNRRRRPQQSGATPFPDVSDLFTDKTCEVIFTPTKSSPVKQSFDPEEISGRSTELGFDASKDDKKYLTPGLEEIFRTSICEDVRNMEDRWRKSVDGRTSILTADMSAMALEDEKASGGRDLADTLQISQSRMSIMSDEFVAAEKVRN